LKSGEYNGADRDPKYSPKSFTSRVDPPKGGMNKIFSPEPKVTAPMQVPSLVCMKSAPRTRDITGPLVG